VGPQNDNEIMRKWSFWTNKVGAPYPTVAMASGFLFNPQLMIRRFVISMGNPADIAGAATDATGGVATDEFAAGFLRRTRPAVVLLGSPATLKAKLVVKIKDSDDDNRKQFIEDPPPEKIIRFKTSAT